jgi:hypothetical protein
MQFWYPLSFTSAFDKKSPGSYRISPKIARACPLRF